MPGPATQRNWCCGVVVAVVVVVVLVLALVFVPRMVLVLVLLLGLGVGVSVGVGFVVGANTATCRYSALSGVDQRCPDTFEGKCAAGPGGRGYYA